MITTLPDAVNYCNRRGMELVQHIQPVTQDGLHYSQSAWQTLAWNMCDFRSFSSLMNYLLQGDYGEMGYVWASNGKDKNIMFYISEAGCDYLLKPLDYVKNRPDQFIGWPTQEPEELITCAADFQIIADSIMAHWPMRNIREIYQICAEGSFVIGSPKGIISFPEGMEVTDYMGRGFEYVAAALNWQDQTRMDDPNIEVYVENPVDIPKLLETHFPELSKPLLNKEQVVSLHQAGNFPAASAAITQIVEAFDYVQEEGKTNPRQACEIFCLLLDGDFDSMGTIEMHFPGNYYCLAYLEQDSQFYALDPLSPSAPWIFGEERGALINKNADLDVLAQIMSEAFPHSDQQANSIVVEPFIVDEHGAAEVPYVGVTYPEALGLPLLSDEQIEALVTETDYAKIAETITTLPDAINFCFHYDIAFNDRRNNNTHGHYNYFQSACQVLRANEGQCVSMSNLFHYLLEGDYDEVGYVHVRSKGGGHIMNYILEDDLYYLINSVEYTNRMDDSIDRQIRWLSEYPGLVGCSADFQEIADSIVQFLPMDDHNPPNWVHLIKSPGDFVMGKHGIYQLYPEGTEVTEYYGFGVAYDKYTVLDWQSQTRIDY